MELLNARSADFDALTKLYRDVVVDLRNKGIYQWDSLYPNDEVLKSDIVSGDLYHLGLQAAIVLNESQEPEYDAIQWDDKGGKVLCIHRLVIHPALQGKGLGKRVLDFVHEYALLHNYSSIRLDAYSGNQAALRLYENSGYVVKGELYFPRREMPFYCFEKVIRFVVGS